MPTSQLRSQPGTRAIRLDAAIALRGLARSRSHAQTLVNSGAVRVNGVLATKASQPISDDMHITVESEDRFVSRAALKLVAALDTFTQISVEQALCLDVGASTGGFSQVLLDRGAKTVLAIDVGHGQLAPQLADEERLILVEGCNARYLTAASLAELTGVTEQPTVLVADLSFISLSTVLPAMVESVAATADIVLLVKPQFEVGRTRVHAGVVTDPTDRAEAIRQVVCAAKALGLSAHGLVPSPITGTAGNQEYLLWLRNEPGGASIESMIDEVMR